MHACARVYTIANTARIRRLASTIVRCYIRCSTSAFSIDAHSFFVCTQHHACSVRLAEKCICYLQCSHKASSACLCINEKRKNAAYIYSYTAAYIKCARCATNTHISQYLSACASPSVHADCASHIRTLLFSGELNRNSHCVLAEKYRH